jgi:ADP-ribose pyrophosphatase YjhB (NUDIX family)
MNPDLSNLTDEQLAAELRRRGLFDEKGLIKLPVYQIGVETLPIVCVDVIPVKEVEGKNWIGVIRRATGPEAGKLALVGGRVWKDLSIPKAVGYHLKNDLNITEWKFQEGNSEEHPFYVQQYFQRSNSEDKYGYDPTKHAVAMVYLVEISGEPAPRNEADIFIWVSENEMPKLTAYNHGLVMKQAFEKVG